MEYQSNMQKSNNLPRQRIPAQNTTDSVTKLRSFGSRKNVTWLFERRANDRAMLGVVHLSVLGLSKESYGI